MFGQYYTNKLLYILWSVLHLLHTIIITERNKGVLYFLEEKKPETLNPQNQ